MFATRNQSHLRLRQPVTVLASLGVAVAIALFAAASVAQTSKQVSVYANVEKDGNLILGLGPQNFRLFEDNQGREFHLAQPETPMSIALLVEYSQSSYPYFSDIQTALNSFIRQAPQGNWYALATFSHNLQVQQDFTKQIGRITTAFSQLGEPTWDETDTYDAIYEMLDKMGELPGRRALIVIGSGIDSFSQHTLSDVQKKLEGVNVLVYGVGAGSMLRGIYQPYLSNMQQMTLIQARAFLQMLANKSGGEAWFPKLEGAYPDVMKGIIQDLENQYRLVYESRVPHDNKLHKIKVEAFRIVNDKRQNFKVRVREGWRY